MSEKLSGIYRTNWQWEGKFYDGTAIIFHSDNAIIGLEICTDTDERNGGMYFLNGSITKRIITGQWGKLGNSQQGGFRLAINSSGKQWQGGYNISLKTKKYPYIYTFNYLRKTQ